MRFGPVQDSFEHSNRGSGECRVLYVFRCTRVGECAAEGGDAGEENLLEPVVPSLRKSRRLGQPFRGGSCGTKLGQPPPQKGGRPKKLTRDARQMNVSFVA